MSLITAGMGEFSDNTSIPFDVSIRKVIINVKEIEKIQFKNKINNIKFNIRKVEG